MIASNASQIEHIGSATLYLGDSMEILPTLGPVADMLITDPPYAAAAATAVTGRAREKWGGNWGDMSLVAMMARAVFHGGVLLPQHQAYWFCDHLTHAALIPMLFGHYPLLQTIVWDKDLLGMGAHYRKQTELVLYARTANAESVRSCKRDLVRITPVSGPSRVHPAEKPLALIEHLLADSQWRCALDPFMGSGTAGVIATRMGRPFIGVEIEREYFDVACERIAAELKGARQRNLFEENINVRA
jgi:DNA modification methylase